MIVFSASGTSAVPFSMMPPTSPPFWASLTEVGRWWRLTMLRPST